ncbi:hypothetical protein DTG75_20065 [Salmonella enterica subsp. salamae]|uniref:Uncharacterized protein n=1 Tax=Salmonella enterica subsp. salamae serovar 55:k:z39 str. 1315K TaxID=1243602 RepID=A0A6C7C3A8_SALER|nr:hypothetical protein LFZ47_09245 [Salmonella enterica subsp. salamae serovar 55:k:z39 str. 1315K]ECG1251231.1 hypothetical protein [Salmonella enterica subsp. salamae]ECG1478527.1 hypothetical protein [Salmonella enterica subsp. salamae]MJZ05001.1 hypothetical protein [Salmonella enterica subsp. salamae]
MVGIISARLFKPGLIPGFFFSILIDLSRLLNINLIICVYRNEDNLNCFRLRCTLFTQALKL